MLLPQFGLTVQFEKIPQDLQISNRIATPSSLRLQQSEENPYRFSRNKPTRIRSAHEQISWTSKVTPLDKSQKTGATSPQIEISLDG